MKAITWSESEKRIARRAFETALNRECAAILDRVKTLIANAEGPRVIWSIHDYLAEQRRSIDLKYDFRYSQLIIVFGVLLRERWIEEGDIAGLREEKLRAIRNIAQF